MDRAPTPRKAHRARLTSLEHLRVAIATDGPILAWQAELIDSLAAIPGVTIVRWDRVAPVVVGATGDEEVGARRIVAVPKPLTAAIDDAYREPDVVMDLTARTPSALGPEETWYLAYGRSRIRDAQRAAVADFVLTPGQTLVALMAAPGGKVLREGLLTCRREEQLQRMLLDSSGWPAGEAARRLSSPRATSPTAGIDASPGIAEPHAADPRAARAVAVPMVALRLAATGRRGLRMKDALTKHDDWNVGVIAAPIAEVVVAGATQPISWFDLRPDRFAADPFGVERGGTTHVFFEDYDQLEGRGTIAHVALTEDGTWTNPVTVLDPGVHASYPYLIEDDGAIFMLPETSAANELILYEASDFPNGWKPAITLLKDAPVVDASVVRFEGRWWMFGTIANRGAAHNLYLWHAPALGGPWEPHRGNPVKTDARSARPGGTPFVMDGRLFRPSQDCSKTYGGAITICRVDQLTVSRFVETPVRSLGSQGDSPHQDGFHTLSAVGGRTLVDGKTRHLVKGVLRRTIRARVRPIAHRLPRVGTR